MTAIPPVINLSGRIGHLTEAQTTALDEFKQRLQDGGYYTPAEDGKDASHAEATIVRFLRARKFQIDGAYDQFVASEKWRKSDKVDDLYRNFNVDEFRIGQLVYSQWTGTSEIFGAESRITIAGQPLLMYRLSELSKERINEYSKKADRAAPRLIALSETLTEFVVPFCNALPREHLEVPVDSVTSIIDISNVSLSKFWSLRNHMQMATKMQTANYPEMLGHMYLVGAPGFFATVWGWIQKGFDQGTVEKMHVLTEAEVFPTLSRYILPENIPKRYGGTLDFEYDDRPNLDAEAIALLELKDGEKLPRAPLRYRKKEGLTILGTGRPAGEAEGMNGRGAGKGAKYVAAEEEKDEEKGAVEKLEANGVKENGSAAPPALEAAKEVPGAPIKDLAATLEGTAL
ncbi:BZ3500_MvSof-1268-A1-R1_Chr10-1g02578 [Microbotryum saponariae]|uniref:BZ3500_MvSof-1268-A1-R1_Chr10-1g02578 protein n=1 Tax=Microbotryum saponariae TaxID=289078 RepID=A0A2X0L9E2_9BASI|nr:BZ3500_MvSof-1268-A1-R1_Chr10-1g02578 [Microbotryum saponariae]SDA06067.1 BZ3501_MvSof-1269-A2-R1_Chr10-1g02179 [Microbotryum saponariae]